MQRLLMSQYVRAICSVCKEPWLFINKEPNNTLDILTWTCTYCRAEAPTKPAKPILCADCLVAEKRFDAMYELALRTQKQLWCATGVSYDNSSVELYVDGNYRNILEEAKSHGT